MLGKLVGLVASLVTLCLTAPAFGQELPSPRAIVERAIEAHGGTLFRDPGTLQLTGIAIFYDPATGAVRSRADDYRMWRTFDADRSSAHGASGKVRISARQGDETLFEIGYDGQTTWTERGIMPRARADAYWASNFGFGIIRRALGAGFALSNAPSRDIRGRLTQMVRITDPQGGQTLFGFDAESGFITYMAFDAPRGFHERIYGNFAKLQSGWVQARSVTLLYDGVISNTVLWQQTIVGEPIAPSRFTPPDHMRAMPDP